MSIKRFGPFIVLKILLESIGNIGISTNPFLCWIDDLCIK